MVKKLTKGSEEREFYICEECGFSYETNELAKKCQDWCQKHHSCSLKITKHAVNLKH